MKANNNQFRQSLSSQVNTIEQEARMILPGIQTLFGFQLISVFSTAFQTELSSDEKGLHLFALILISISAVLVIAPAAYHRQANHQISEHFVRLSTRFLALALFPLALGTCIDVYIVARVTTHSDFWSMVIAVGLFALQSAVWFIYPRLRWLKIRELPSKQIP
jgi:hypothetical protein